jgi:D-glycero-D-manno-heptose 1,7-bisphosphate phosphatase
MLDESRKALFLDRDGVINERIIGGYVVDPSQFILLHDILPILSLARSAGYLLILASNQQGVGKGLMTQRQLDAVNQHMQDVLTGHLGSGLDDIRICTSLASANDPRRKPAPGMLLEAIKDHHLDPSLCWFLGDSVTDAHAGKGAGVRTALVGDFDADAADLVAPDLREMSSLLAPFLKSE